MAARRADVALAFLKKFTHLGIKTLIRQRRKFWPLFGKSGRLLAWTALRLNTQNVPWKRLIASLPPGGKAVLALSKIRKKEKKTVLAQNS